MSFARAMTPRNPSFYISDSPANKFKYQPQRADSYVYARTHSLKMIRSKGRRQKFILVGKVSNSDATYDAQGVASSRVLENTSNRSALPSPGQYHANSRYIVSASQIKKYLNTTTPPLRRSKTVNERGRYVPPTVQHRVTVPRYTDKQKKT